MLHLLNSEETPLMVIHKHWFVMTGPVILFLVLLFVPPVVLTLLPLVTQNLDPAVVEPATNFILSLYIMVLLVVLFLVWMNFYLDMWIITNQRIIDVVQKGLFNRDISEIPLSHVQDVTIEMHGIIETFLKFGTLRVQTAGEREFLIKDIPNLYEAKDTILKNSLEIENRGINVPPPAQTSP